MCRLSLPVAITKQAFFRRLGVSACAVTIFVTAFAFAHRMPGSLSTIKTNASTGIIEIIHRLHIHDAELGMVVLTGERQLTLDQLSGRARLALYVEEQFIIAPVVDGKIGPRLPLELIGAELDGDFVLVYQQYAGKLPAEIAVSDTILSDVFPGQINHVNVATGDEIRSLTFSDGDGWLTLQLE
jgi:hypothetical protein